VRFLTPKEVRELVSLSRTTLWRLCRAGVFPKPVRISAGRVAFVQQQVEDWMRARANPGEPLQPGSGASPTARPATSGSRIGPPRRG
jgi:prophage regulatory protein